MGLNPESVPPSGDDKELPLWRKEFPIDTAADGRRSRRAFLGGLTVAGGTMACGQAVFRQSLSDGGESAGWQTLPHHELPRKLTDLKNGEALHFYYPDERSPCLLIKLNESEFVAYAQKCTHLACPVVPSTSTTESRRDELHCPCHHGSFDLRTGEVLAGPPRRPLPRIRMQAAADGTLTATGLERV